LDRLAEIEASGNADHSEMQELSNRIYNILALSDEDEILIDCPEVKEKVRAYLSE
jgi:hypothetical protein